MYQVQMRHWPINADPTSKLCHVPTRLITSHVLSTIPSYNRTHHPPRPLSLTHHPRRGFFSLGEERNFDGAWCTRRQQISGHSSSAESVRQPGARHATDSFTILAALKTIYLPIGGLRETSESFCPFMTRFRAGIDRALINGVSASTAIFLPENLRVGIKPIVNEKCY